MNRRSFFATLLVPLVKWFAPEPTPKTKWRTVAELQREYNRIVSLQVESITTSPSPRDYDLAYRELNSMLDRWGSERLKTLHANGLAVQFPADRWWV